MSMFSGLTDKNELHVYNVFAVEEVEKLETIEKVAHYETVEF